ncbi:hypothetical protein MWH05_00130 [Candidatus Blochmanniella pennsylvanica]|nr:hypothetical protein [Candidatus Blochmannia pennsylvanicus]UOY04392.1 hypothetical protein MWH05_00130 [Candidatus Blochmannia pennsylvanicus]
MYYINSEKNKIPDIPNININSNSIEMIWFRIYQFYQDICNRSELIDFNELLKHAYMLC